MNVKYFGQSNKNNGSDSLPKSYSLHTYTSTNNDNDIEYNTYIKYSKGLIGYANYKGFLAHIYQIIVNRLVRTAHLLDISSSK